MTDARRWLLIAVAVLAVLALLLFARGVAHHRGWQIGDRAAATATDVRDA